MRSTEHHESRPATASKGVLGMLWDLARAKGTRAPSVGSAATAVSRRACKCAPLLVVLGSLGAFAAAAAPANAANTPWWQVGVGAVPSYLPAEGTGHVRVTFSNLGDAQVDGAGSPVRMAVTLPAGFTAVGISGVAGLAGDSSEEVRRGHVICSAVGVSPLVCTYAGTLPPFDHIELIVEVQLLPGAETGARVQASVSGGGAAALSVSRPLTVGPAGEEVPFGLQSNEFAVEEQGGAPDLRAGSHPFQVTSTLALNQITQEDIDTGGNERPEPAPVALPKDIDAKIPPGLIGNATALPRCTIGQFLTRPHGSEIDGCAASTAIGVASVLVNEPIGGLKGFSVPVFNLEPRYGEPARFGFYIGITETPVLLDTALRSGPGEDYGVTVSSTDTSQLAGLLSSQVTLWGVPGDPAHDASRGWGCLDGLREQGSVCEGGSEPNPPAFLTTPTSCSGQPLEGEVVLDSWADPSKLVAQPFTSSPEAMEGCNQLSFVPSFQAEPTTTSASSPSGLNVNLDFHDEGLTAAEGTAESQLNKTQVVLPEGLTVNPSSGVGLAGCTPADYERETIGSAPGAGCPNESKLGTVEIQTPLLSQPIHGNIFIAQPYENPFPEPENGHPGGTLIALYIVAKNPETGILIKLAGKVTPNRTTGQLTTTFENNPQLAFSHFNFHFREGSQAPLITPPACGSYSTEALLFPWKEPLSAVTDTSAFELTSGVDGGACPSGGAPPFNPQISAGTLNNNAGSFSSFDVHITRGDADQEISTFTTDMPEGLTGDLTGVPYCPEADIALARSKSGKEEEANPSCPAASQIGHTLVGTGAGPVLAYTPGRLYLSGPYQGDPFSLVSVTSAVVGPFDLGTVVLRFGLHIDPITAKVSVDPTASEPIPTILEGIVTHVRDIRVYVDRPNFILNPTSCEPSAIQSTVTGNQGASSTISSRFQAASCQNLKYEPTLAVSTAGAASKTNGASLHFKIAYPKNAVGSESWMKEMKFDIPKQLPARLTTIQQACLAATFEHNRGACPAHSIIGHVLVHTPILPVPLEGPLYFVSYGGAAFPDAVAVIKGDGVTIENHGKTFIDGKTGVTSATFDSVPDVPFENIEVEVPTGPYSEFGANLGGSYDFCGHALTMPILFKAQNGMEIKKNVPVGVTGCPKGLTTKQKLAAALKACHKKHGKKRAACEKAARKKYATKASKTSKKRGRR
jgi:hypothetical protein